MELCGFAAGRDVWLSDYPADNSPVWRTPLKIGIPYNLRQTYVYGTSHEYWEM